MNIPVGLRAFVLPLALLAGGAGGAAGRSEVLHSGSEKEILAYLGKGHRIPHIPVAMTGGSLYNEQRHGREIDRAVALFKKGSPPLRLAIAKALSKADEARFLSIWDACTDQDYEARHHLVGLGLRAVEGERSQDLLAWLLTQAHPSYAAALLKRLDRYTLYSRLGPRENPLLIPFVKALYRQTGEVVVFKRVAGDAVRKDTVRPVQELAVALVPVTASGRELALSWLASDAKKVDKRTLMALWVAWARMCSREANLVDDAYVDRTIARLDMAEAWLLCEDKGGAWLPRDKQRRLDFRRNLWAQVFNPDPRVRREAIRYVLGQPRDSAFAHIRTMRANPLRTTVAAEAQEIARRLARSAGKDQPAERAFYLKGAARLQEALGTVTPE